ncbi:monovalent cation/H(+) antiporter subunit G [Brucella pseudogrignonensis]|uniref:monovalent cation/H(+) antiporter subunit G n=1 Tax=Brucella pseudogrignonensis TaxID=419475 RepID=UPI00190DA557|nr:monovalent cation/H(+) antiporter subunit G [Brucella pseudogrignonensis]MBK0021938.1 cation:proton antiporter [Ochrobactrum sp. S45]MBK0043952.1 cation:proton antiporter [Ochrobactrum sp. S46]UKK93659.1 monovalent cation/H(+) antiporter subunit G [Brucella pseudogrignonensis]
MIGAADLPVWAAIIISFFLVAGAFLTLVGCIGLVRFKSFYERIHAPTIGSSFGAGGILIASIMFFSILQSKPILHEVLITVFVVITTPVTLMLLSRAVIHRDQTQDSKELPSSSNQK